MGDRALVQFVSKDKNGKPVEFSPAVYLHWHGGRVPEFIRECAALMQGREGDVEYSAARFVGICHGAIAGNLSLGIQRAQRVLTKSDSQGDAGCFIVDCGSWQVEAFGGYGEPFDARG